MELAFAMWRSFRYAPALRFEFGEQAEQDGHRFYPLPLLLGLLHLNEQTSLPEVA